MPDNAQTQNAESTEVKKEAKKDLTKTLGLIPLSRFNDYFDYPSVGTLRQLQFYNTDNFTTKVLRKIGHRVYISISSLREWINETNRKQAV